MHFVFSILPVISSRQESPHGQNLRPPRTPSLGGSLAPISRGVGGYTHQMPLDAVQHFTHKLADVLTQSFDQAAEEIACSCRHCLQDSTGTDICGLMSKA